MSTSSVESVRTSRRGPRSVEVTARSVTRAPEESAARRTRRSSAAAGSEESSARRIGGGGGGGGRGGGGGGRSSAAAGSEESSARRIGGVKRVAERASESSRWSRRLDSSDGATPRYTIAIAAITIAQNGRARRRVRDRSFYASVSRKRYPTPRTVKRYSGSLASSSSFSRRWRMWTSIVRGSR